MLIPAKPGPEDGMVVRLRAKVVVRVVVCPAFLQVEGGYGGAGSGATFTSGQPYGDGMISHLIGGSGGGGYSANTAGGGGGGAIRLEASGKIGRLVRSSGGGGTGGSAGGSGGAIHLKAAEVYLLSQCFP